MSPTDTTEKVLEFTIVRCLLDHVGYRQGNSRDYDWDHALDLIKLQARYIFPGDL